MKKQLLSCVLLVLALPVLAQIPRNAGGHFEYTQAIQLDNSPSILLQERAKKFFNLPMLVHWDSTYSAGSNGGLIYTGEGYVEIGISSGMFGSRVKVGLQYLIQPSDNGYQYSIRRLVVRGEDGQVFPLEEKPPPMKNKYYDQLVNRTHRYLQRVVGYMKRVMSESR
ncbi:MAG: hypothetical protein J7578_13155 [Chitinophagaceae bacterium]|nr:hypothetical protein [Chitinophagaceae bacterium]